MTSLAAIRDPEVISRIEQRFADEAWDFQLYASDVLGRYKLPESEAALLRLYDRVRDPKTQVPVALALCDLFSREGMPACLAACRHETGLETNDLRVATLAVARAIGYELSAAEQELLSTRFSLSPTLTHLLRQREDFAEWDDEDYVDSTPVRVDQLASRR